MFAGLVLLVVGAAISELWRRRASILEWPGRKVRDSRVKRKMSAEARRLELVHHVLERAEVLKVDVPARVHTGRPARVVWHPSTRMTMHYHGDHQRRAEDLRAGRVTVSAMRPGRAPTGVFEWSTEQLQAWLKEHRDASPPG